MTTTIQERINELSAEKIRLYAEASAGGHAREQALARIKAIEAEIQSLWEERRRERAGRREGIDLVMDKIYERTYGSDYEDAIAPAPVTDASLEPEPQPQAA